MDTSKVILEPSKELKAGQIRNFYAIAQGSGEPYIQRCEIFAPIKQNATTRIKRRLSVVHATDFQLSDPSSPARFEFVNKHFGIASAEELFPGHRSQELLAPFAISASIKYINELARERGIDMCVITGDTIDNGQCNEMDLLITLLTDTKFSPSKSLGSYFGVQSKDWNDDFYWHPSNDTDKTQVMLGYPRVDGLLEALDQVYDNEPLEIPWLISNGNHESLIQGMGFHSDAVEAFALGSEKPLGPVDELDLSSVKEVFQRTPEKFFAQLNTREVARNPSRSRLSSKDFIQAVKTASGSPAMHGFADHTPEDDHVYFFHYDTETDCLYIFLDTAVRSGGASGGIDKQQFGWLKQILLNQVASRNNRSAIVIISSHHGLEEINFDHDSDVSRDDLLGLIFTYPEIKLWLCGHTHVNEIMAYSNPNYPGAGFYQITTASLMDWPCTIRTIEIFDHQDQSTELQITVHTISEGRPTGLLDTHDLANWHVLIAGNSPYIGFKSSLEGQRSDRNVRAWIGPTKIH